MKHSLLLLFAFFCSQTFIYAQQQTSTVKDKKVSILLYNDGTWSYADTIPQFHQSSPIISGLEIPKTKPTDKIISHTGYSLLFNNKHKQANWVAYELTSGETNKQFERTDKFLIDPMVKSGTATDADYSGSGYDRGHLAPAADMGWSSATISESFYYSNMSPQLPGFNRGIWKKLEELVRTWAVENNALYIVTGPVLTYNLPTIGPDKVSVPKYFYKVILDYTQPEINGIGFIIPNASSSEPLQEYAVTIDSVEKLTDIDFYPTLPDDQETQIEKTLCLNCWSWKSTKTNKKGSDNKESTSVQCKGNTKAGAQCKNKTQDPSGYCYLHNSQQTPQQSTTNTNTQTAPAKSTTKSTSVQCSGTTKAGSRCKNMTTNSNGRCYQHGAK
jgi:endonuclease G